MPGYGLGITQTLRDTQQALKGERIQKSSPSGQPGVLPCCSLLQICSVAAALLGYCASFTNKTSLWIYLKSLLYGHLETLVGAHLQAPCSGLHLCP